MGKQITACSLDCPDSCSLEVTVEDGQLIALDGIADGPNPSTNGWICAKVKNTPQLLHGPDRITTPLRRSGPKGSGEFVEISWDEALDLFAAKVTEAVAAHGWESVVPYLYSSSAGKLGRAGLSPLVWEHFGAARTDITICAATVGEAWERTYGSMPSADPDDLQHSELIVVWGANPNVSHPHLSPVIEERRRAGAKLIVVDPRRTPIATRADLHLAVRPGTDGVLAMAIAALLQRDGHLDREFIDRWVDGADEYLAACQQWTPARAAEICGIDVADIERFAEMYGTIRPAMLRVGWGQERNRNGGSASRAVFALPGAGRSVRRRRAPGCSTRSAAERVTTQPRSGERSLAMHRSREATDQHEPPRAHPRRRRGRARRGAVRAGLEPGGNLPRAGHRVGRPGPRRSVHRRARPDDDRHRPARRPGAAGDVAVRGRRDRRQLRLVRDPGGARP